MGLGGAVEPGPLPPSLPPSLSCFVSWSSIDFLFKSNPSLHHYRSRPLSPEKVVLSL